MDGQLRYDPMSMRPFMSYPEGAYAAHWLQHHRRRHRKPIFAHVNWFQRDPDDGHFLWPGYRDNLRPLLWLLKLKDGEVKGKQTPVGIVPTTDELDLEGIDITPGGPRRRSSASTPHAGPKRWLAASSTWPSSTACPRRSGRLTGASLRRWPPKRTDASHNGSVAWPATAYRCNTGV